MKPNNPFLISGYHSPEFFCDRVSETNNILNALYNGRNVTLIAPRRMGKTGLIRHAFYHSKLQNPEITTLYMDIFSTQSLRDFVNLFESAAGVLSIFCIGHQLCCVQNLLVVKECFGVFVGRVCCQAFGDTSFF